MKSFEYQSVVVPFDFSDSSKLALEHALDWSNSTTRIHLIFVVVPTASFISMDPTIQIPPSFDIETRALAESQMQTMFESEKYAQVQIHCTIGDPGTEIAAWARQVEADIIVMPSHGRTGLTRLLLGSVAERVLRLAHCPVLILRGERYQGKDVELNETQAQVSATNS